MKLGKDRKGQLSLQVVIFSAVAVITITGFVVLTLAFLKLSVRSFNKSAAFGIAEAGIEYYRWHLAHDNADFQDGTGGPGPYTHNYYDKNGTLIGQFILNITPPLVGSTIVTVESTGKIFADASVQKTIRVKLGIPSFAKYAWVLNDNVVFGSAAEVFGPVHSNAGIHFDGLAHNLVSSALTNYTDPDNGLNEWAVYTQSSPADPQPPTALPNRPDVFLAGRQLGLPAVNFAGITQDLAQIMADAQAGGFYRASSTAQGYDVVLKTDDTFDLYKVTAISSPPSGCSNSQSGWGTWSIQSETLLGNYAFPANGLIFLEDNIWVRGQINTARLTIASARFPDDPTKRSSITVNSNVLYTNYNGQDVLSLIAQNNINVGLASADNLRIDGALMAQNGRVGRYSYSSSNCGTNRTRTSLTSYGMMGTNARPAFVYSSSNGYQSRDYIYDSNLLYSPPPSFPLSSDQYTQLLWYEVQ